MKPARAEEHPRQPVHGRTSDINSATSQFFVNLSDNAFLDHGPRDYGYAVFGRITEGWRSSTRSRA